MSDKISDAIITDQLDLRGPADGSSPFAQHGVMVAIWEVLVHLINARDRQSNALLEAIAKQLDNLDDSPTFDRTRLDGLLAQLDDITTPAQPEMPAAPRVGNLMYEQQDIPQISQRQTDLPDMPALRALMDIGPAPDIDDAGDGLDYNQFRNLFVEERDALIALVKAGFEDFIARFLPPSQYLDEAMGWLSDAVNARNTGIPVHVEEQIYERHRARIGKETDRQIATSMQSWAGRGYTLPPGALVGQVNQARRDQSDQLSTASRDIVIYVTDKHIENARFAVEQILSLRNQAMAQAMDYMKSLLISPQYAGQWITAMFDNRAKVASARADIYKARAGAATDVFKVENEAVVDFFKAAATANLEDVRNDNSTKVEYFRALLEQDKTKFLGAIEEFRARTGADTDVYKTTSDALLRYYEGATRVTGIKAEVIGRTADTALKIEDSLSAREMQLARLKVDAAMELLKTHATQSSAALNNMQLSSGYSSSYTVSQQVENE